MTPAEVRAAVLEVARRARTDREVAHALQDELWLSLLRAIADGACDDPAACCREAAKTADLGGWWYS